MSILVIGGTGNVGQHLVESLVKMGESPRVLVRDPRRADLLPSGATAIVGDIVKSPDDVRATFRGVKAVFMLNAVSPHETVEGMLAVALAREAGVDRFVYQSAHCLEQFGQVPHLGAKLAIGNALAASGLDYAILYPNHFFQNDAGSFADITSASVYRHPVGRVGCWRIDTRDIGEAAAKLLVTRDGDRLYALVGPEKLSGAECAAIWSDALNRPVRYEGDLASWQSAAAAFLPPWLSYDLRLMFETIDEKGMLGNAADLQRLIRLLGRPPRDYRSYVRECIANKMVR